MNILMHGYNDYNISSIPPLKLSYKYQDPTFLKHNTLQVQELVVAVIVALAIVIYYKIWGNINKYNLNHS